MVPAKFISADTFTEKHITRERSEPLSTSRQTGLQVELIIPRNLEIKVSGEKSGKYSERSCAICENEKHKP